MLKKVVFKILDMACVSCSITIDGDLEDTQGIKSSRTSYAKAVSEVEFDSEKISEQQILAIMKKSGYIAKAQEHKV